jgi:hypothetical protein
MHLPPKPRPPSEIDRALWGQAEVRQSILDERWEYLVSEAMTAFYAAEVLARITHIDLSRNPAAYAWNALNTLYDDTPTVAAEDTPAEALALTSTPELWALRHESQLRAIAIGESLMRLDVRDGQVRYRVVGAEYVEMQADPDRPGVLGAIRETRLRDLGMGPEWTRETWAPARAEYRVEAYRERPGGGSSEWVDVTATAWPDGGYPYVDATGPILPYVLCHLELHGALRRPGRWTSLVSATVAAAVLHTWWLMGMRDCASPQTIALDSFPAGAATDPTVTLASTVEIQRLVKDPSSIALFKSANGTGGSVFNLDPTMDPSSYRQSIDDYIATALRDCGLGPTDEAPAKGVSGAAIAVSREALRRSQRQQRPAAEQADREILATAARLARIASTPPAPLAALLPTDPSAYSISYRGIAPSTDEIRTAAERQRILLDLGLTERWRAIMEVHPEITRTEAEAMAARIERQRIRMAAPPRAARPAAPAPEAEDSAEDDIEDRAEDDVESMD